MSDKGLAKSPPEHLKPKEWVTAVHLGFQQQIVTFLLWAYGFLLVVTATVIFLQGFHLRGFNLDISLLKWLGVATIGEIGRTEQANGIFGLCFLLP